MRSRPTQILARRSSRVSRNHWKRQRFQCASTKCSSYHTAASRSSFNQQYLDPSIRKSKQISCFARPHPSVTPEVHTSSISLPPCPSASGHEHHTDVVAVVETLPCTAAAARCACAVACATSRACPGRKPPVWAVKPPARPYKCAIQHRFIQENATEAELWEGPDRRDRGMGHVPHDVLGELDAVLDLSDQERLSSCSETFESTARVAPGGHGQSWQTQSRGSRGG